MAERLAGGEDSPEVVTGGRSLILRARGPDVMNKHRAPRYDVGKSTKRPETLKAIGKPGRTW